MSDHIRRLLNQNLVHFSVATAASLMLVVGIVLGWQAYHGYQDTAELKRSIAAADALLAASDIQARERGLGALLLAQPGADWARRALTEVRSEAENRWARAFLHLERVAADRSGDRTLTERRRQLQAHHGELHTVRGKLDQFLAGMTPAPDLHDWLATASELNKTAARMHEEIMLGITLPPQIAYASLAVKRAAWVASEHAGQNRAIFAYFTEAGTPVPGDYLAVLRSNRAVAERAMQELLQLRQSPRLDTGLIDSLEHMSGTFRSHCRPARERMFAASTNGDYPQDSRQWFDTATGCIDTMLAVSLAASRSTQDKLEQWTERRLLLFTAYLVFAAVAGLLALFSLARVRRNTREYFRQKELAEVTLSSIGDAVITTDTGGRIEYINPVAQELTGWSAEEGRGRPFREVFHIYNRIHASMADPVGTCLAEGTVIGLTSGHVLIRHDGHEIPIEDSAAPIRDHDGNVVGAVVVFYDTRKAGDQANHLLSYHATRDALTGLVNRREFDHRLGELLERAHQTGERHALAYIDLDQFKIVNDSCGHNTGDRMLRQIAFLLQKRVRASDTLARLGGDEFGLLFSNCTMDQALRVTEELRRAVQDFRFSCEERVFQTSLSIGLIPINADSVSVAELLSEVDSACYAAKEKGRNRVQVYHPDDLELTQRQGEMQWVARINEALDETLEQDRLVLYCQPIRPLRSGLPEHVEITVRMHQADGEVIPPMAFIPAAERYNLMPCIDRWVIRQACAQLAGRPDEASSTTYTLNLSGTTLSDEQLADYIRHQAAEHNIRPECLCFEVTETAAITNLETAVELMQALRRDGFSFALDDFGSGLSSLSYLKNLPIQMLKIDGSFVRNLLKDPLDLAMVQSFASIGRAVRISTCAEFVENEEILTKLLQMDIDYAQGYGIAMPLTLADYLQPREAKALIYPYTSINTG